MDMKDTPVREGSDKTRREFLCAGTAALALAAGTGPAASAGSRQDAGRSADEVSGECRNQQAGMAYRRLGRTGMMISEIVCGGDPITLENYKHLERALERGLNYLDMAPAYNNGNTRAAMASCWPARRRGVTKSSSPPRSATLTACALISTKRSSTACPCRSKRRSAARRGRSRCGGGWRTPATTSPTSRASMGPSNRPTSARRCAPSRRPRRGQPGGPAGDRGVDRRQAQAGGYRPLRPADVPPADGLNHEKALQNYIKAAGKGVLKMMSKMGISVWPLHWRQVFEAVGLSTRNRGPVLHRMTSPLGGVGLDVIAAEVAARHHGPTWNPDARAHPNSRSAANTSGVERASLTSSTRRPSSSCSIHAARRYESSAIHPARSTTRPSVWRRCAAFPVPRRASASRFRSTRSSRSARSSSASRPAR